MKRFIFSLFILLLVMSSSVIAAEHAFDKGAIRIGGNLYFQRVSGTAYSSQTILNFTSTSSIAISKGLFIGLIGTVQNQKSSGSSSRTNWTAGPLVEFYLPSDDVENSLTPYTRFFFTRGETSNQKIEKIGFQLGVMKMITENIGLDFGVSYSFDKIKNNWYVFQPYGYSYYDDTEKTGKSLLVGFGIESYIF